MNPRTTWILLALALLMFSYIWVFERQPQSSVEAGVQARKLLSGLDANRVSTIEITATNNTVIRADRAGERWRLTSPAYPAQEVGIQALLDSLSRLDEQGHIPPKDVLAQPGGLAPFGLEPPRATILVQTDTERFYVRVGRKTPVGDQVYVQLVGSAGVYITPGGFLLHIPRTADDWRDPMLLSLGRRPFDRIEVQSGQRGFDVERDTNGVWRLTKPIPARADENAIERLVQQLRATRVTQFVTDDPRAALEPFGLQPPQAELAIAQGTNRVVHLQFGSSPTNDPTQVYARRLAHTNVVLVPRESIELLRQPFTLFRERALVKFPVGSIDRIEAGTAEKFTLQKQSSGGWTIIEPLSASADTLLVAEFLTNLLQLEIAQFVKDVVTDFAPYGLAPPTRQYTLKGTVTNTPGAVTNIVIAQIGFGATNTVDTTFAQRWDENSVYAVPRGDAERLPAAAFELRDRRVWNFSATNVTAVTIVQKGQTRRLVRDPVRGWSSDHLFNTGLDLTLDLLGQLRAVRWEGRGSDVYNRCGFPRVLWQVTLEVTINGQSQTLPIEFGGLSIKGNPFATVPLSGETERVVFHFPAPVFQEVGTFLSIPQTVP